MVWITKRELAYYIILRRVFENRIFNLGEALDILSLFGSKNVARRVVKRLTSRGLLEKIGSMDYRVRDLEPSLLAGLKSYMQQRMYRRLKSIGFSISISLAGNEEKVTIDNCNDSLRQLIEVLRGFINVMCT